MKRRAAFIIFAVLAATVIALSAPIAAADAPVKSEFVFSDTGVVQGGCPFEVVNSASGSGTETDFFDSSGNLRRIHLHVTEVSTFSANGKSLTSNPFTYEITLLFDEGEITGASISGIITKVPLPDGGLFVSAGRVDLAARGFPQFILTPDEGTSVKLDEFCAALAPVT